MTYIPMVALTLYAQIALSMPAVSSASSLLSHLRLPRLITPAGASYVGIDIGIDAVRVSTFRQRRDATAVSLGAASLAWTNRWQFGLPIDPSAAPPAEWVDVVVQRLRDQLPRCVDGEQNMAMIALPMPWIHYQTVGMSEIAACQAQCDAMFQSSLFQSKAHLRRWPVAEDAEQWVSVATAESAAGQIADAVASVGYSVQGILPHGVALLHAAQPLTSLQPAAVALLELTGGLVALRSGAGCGLCRNLPAVTDPVSSSPYVDELEPWLADIAAEIQATLRYAGRYGNRTDPQAPVLIAGTIADVEGLDAALAALLGRPVATWRYAGRCRPQASMPAAARSDESESPSPDEDHFRLRRDADHALALSLACCGLGHTGSASGGGA